MVSKDDLKQIIVSLQDELAIQVSYSISKQRETYEREVGALNKLPKVLPCRRRLIITNDETDVINDEYGRIEVMPLRQFMEEV